MKRTARFIGMLAALGCFVWSLANFRASTFDTGWYRFAVLMLGTFGPVCFALLLRAEIDEHRAAKRSKEK